MKKFNRLNRDEMRNVLGGLRNPNDPPACEDRICIGGGGCPDGCGCSSIPYNPIPGEESDMAYCTSFLA
ncbi:MAG: hypothetical protein WC615_11330 [Mucilaginibacter sp.]|jgi:hypothetical protein|uniref:hypothetical protein n=1 Tax=Mucilaginibacter sp. TaxID=1882438 RepID=UPI003569F5F9